jgi:hypothetical protein
MTYTRLLVFQRHSCSRFCRRFRISGEVRVLFVRPFRAVSRLRRASMISVTCYRFARLRYCRSVGSALKASSNVKDSIFHGILWRPDFGMVSRRVCGRRRRSLRGISRGRCADADGEDRLQLRCLCGSRPQLKLHECGIIAAARRTLYDSFDKCGNWCGQFGSTALLWWRDLAIFCHTTNC